jgi:hypothetical protein
MTNVAEAMNEQFKQFLDMQTRGMEPMRIFAGLAAESVEKIARQNYAVAGDVLEFSTKAVNLPLTKDNLGDVASAQMTENSNFAELMSTRATEYADMAQSFSAKAREAAEAAAASYK